MRKDILDRKKEILQWISDGWSFPEIYRELGCARDTLYRILNNWGIHYDGNQGLKGRKSDPKRLTADQMIQRIENGHYITNSKLRDRLIKDGIKEAKCECCGKSEWLGRPIVLELHHKDFNHHNTQLDNLQILCSNCHSYMHRYKQQGFSDGSIPSDHTIIMTP